MAKYKALLFDMDGTIADTDEMIIHTMFDLYDKYNPLIKKSREEIIYFSGPPIAITLKKEFPEIDQYILMQDFLDISTPYYDKYTVTYEDEIETLKRFKKEGYRMAVVTNKGHEKAEYVLKLLHLDDIFEFVIGNGDVPFLKPAPDGINEARNRFNVTKEETLYIGDNDIDYETASNAGVDVLICAWGPRTLNVLEKAKYVAYSYKEIGEIIK